MQQNLDRLPYDVLFNIAGRLSFSDVIHLSLTCRQLYQLRSESTLCRKTVENHAPFTKEAGLAAIEEISYRQALERIYFRRGSFATATPSSACVIGYGSSFIYRQNVICYMSHGIIRTRSVLGSSYDADIDTRPMAAWLSAIHFRTTEIQPEISLLHYSDGIVSLHFDYSETELCQQWRDDEHWLIYVELDKFNPMTGAGVNIIKPPAGASKLFVRNTATYLLYGTHTGIGAHGHHEWKIHSHSLADDDQLPLITAALQLDEFVGSDIGSTVAFEIHDGYFYAVSNQTSFVVEEVDWTSFYHCLRFPLDRPFKEALQVNTRVYRRQHAEGPINDSWTDLSLQVDEKTNRLQIVEARREWRNGGSKQERTFYTREVTFPNRSEIRRREGDVNGAVTGGDQDVHMQSASPTSALATASSDATLEEDGGVEDDNAVGSASSQASVPLLPADDLLVQTLSSGNNPHYAPEEERLPRSYHPERRHEDGLSSYPAFILARTKFRAYNLSCSAFFDLVEDDQCCPDVSAIGGPPCLRFRIGARKRSPLLPVPSVPDTCDDADEKGKGRVLVAEERGAMADLTQQQNLPPYEDRFVYPPVKMWPPPGEAPAAALSSSSDDVGKEAAERFCNRRLHGILNASLSPPTAPVAWEDVAAAASSSSSSQETDALFSSPSSGPFSAFSQTSFSSTLSLSTAAAYTPPPPATEIVAAADERSVVFLRRPKYGSGERSGPIVLVSFDRGIEAEALAYRVGGGQQGQAATEAAAATAERKDSGITLAGGLRVDTMPVDKEGADQTMLWKRDWCWDRKCACVRKRAACELA